MFGINTIEFKKFPGGELHITDSWQREWEQKRFNQGKVICRIQSSDDFIKLCLFTDAYKRVFKKLPEELILPYIPYARQDRVPVWGEALSIKVFANLLNSLEYPCVTVLDPHSDVSTALINNVNIIPQWDYWAFKLISLDAANKLDKFDLISPDAGALKKIYNLQSRLGNRTKTIRIGMKHRDVETGKITGTSVDGQPFYKTGIIVDDICDGGRTFVELAKVLRDQYETLILCITHGIFSNGYDELFKYFDKIYSTNSWNPRLCSEDKLEVFQMESL